MDAARSIGEYLADVKSRRYILRLLVRTACAALPYLALGAEGDILKGLHQEHPRLCLSAAGWESLR
jgi:hypothetical protein